MKKYITQIEFSKSLLKLISQIEKSGVEFDYVLGIKNGGLNVSTPIADHFDKPHYGIQISFYDGSQRLTDPIVDMDKLNIVKIKFHGKCLWVDDIIDSGGTLKWFIENTGLKIDKDFIVATLHWCEENSPNLKPHFFVERKAKSDWIVYPWET